ncbi:MAG: hypothetical protein JWQ97_2589, partial [Phenylobacterium sp.]|nr:hypothetical protein [Phenylobacterium sp.]
MEAQLQAHDHAGRLNYFNQLFTNDLARAEQLVKQRLGPRGLANLAQQHFDALTADAYNAGAKGALGPQMLQNIWDGQLSAAGQQFNAYKGTDQSTGQKRILPGLVKRSLEQAAIFNRGDYNYAPSNADIDAATRAAIAASVRRRPAGRLFLFCS